MIITNPEELGKYTSAHRKWQGIPTIEITGKGRIFVAFYSGKDTETWGNYVLLVKSDDDGKTWSEPITVIDVGDGARAFDPCLWMDPDGCLRLFWSVMPDHHIEYAVCREPDAETLLWSEPKTMPGGVMLNKPVVLSDGSWLFPAAVWPYNVFPQCPGDPNVSDGTMALISRDHGETYEELARVSVESRQFDEPMFYEKKDGTLVMLIRTYYGIARSVSRDGGHIWTPDDDSHLGGPNSRFYIGRLSSGNLLLINHYKFVRRNNLTAMISRDDGETFSEVFRFEGRKGVSYPDAKEYNGKIYVVYDRERGAHYRPEVDYTNDAREILLAVFTEEDIAAGKPVSESCRLQQIVSKLNVNP